MPKLNENYQNVKDSYLFAEIARRVKENEIEKEQLIKIQNSNKAYHDFSRLSKKGPFFTVELQINSGDTLTIICEDLDCNIL